MDNNAYLLRCTQTGELALIDAACAGGLGGPLDGLGAEGDTGQARHQGGGAGEGDFHAGQGAHLGQARGQRAAGPQAELPVAGREPMLAGGSCRAQQQIMSPDLRLTTALRFTCTNGRLSLFSLS